MAEPESVMRAFNQTGNVGDCRPAITGEFDHANNRMQRSKRIRCDLGPRRRNSTEQRRFACVRVTNQCSIRHRAQLQEEMLLLAFFALGVLTRRAIPRTLKMYVALPARAAMTQNEFLAIPRKIDKGIIFDFRFSIFDFCGSAIGRWVLGVGRWAFLVVCRPNNRPNWHPDDFVGSSTTSHFLSHPVAAVLRLDDRFIKQIREIINMPIGPYNDVATPTPVAAIGPAL